MFTLRLRSVDMKVAFAADFGRGLALFSLCRGELVALPGLDIRAADRGVTLPFASTSLSGAIACFAFGVGGSDRTVGVDRGPDDFAGGVALPLTATRGAIGVRAVRVDASDGFSGLLVLVDRIDSEAIAPFRYHVIDFAFGARGHGIRVLSLRWYRAVLEGKSEYSRGAVARADSAIEVDRCFRTRCAIAVPESIALAFSSAFNRWRRMLKISFDAHLIVVVESDVVQNCFVDSRDSDEILHA